MPEPNDGNQSGLPKMCWTSTPAAVDLVTLGEINKPCRQIIVGSIGAGLVGLVGTDEHGTAITIPPSILLVSPVLNVKLKTLGATSDCLDVLALF